MGGGSWTADTFASYTACSKGVNLSDSGYIDATFLAQEMFKASHLDDALNPYKVVRECRDTEEHPNTKPVILALDVTGSMGDALVEVAKTLNVVMTDLYSKVNDVEFMIMGIGDLAYDCSPIQASQFESDIRIAEQLDKLWFERGGGGNNYESYTAAWYFGLHHTDLDCWKRGQKGVIITLGDEELNPYLPSKQLGAVTGDSLNQISSIETADLYPKVIEKFDVYHLSIKDPSNCYWYHHARADASFSKYLDSDHYKVVYLKDLANEIVSIVTNAFSNSPENTTGAIVW